MNRKEWLEQQIEESETRELFVGVSETGKLFLKEYKRELGVIYETSRNKEKTL